MLINSRLYIIQHADDIFKWRKTHVLDKYVCGGKLIRDLHLKYDGGGLVRIPEDLNTISYFELCNIVQKGLGYHTLLNVHYYIPGSRSFDDGLRLIWDAKTILDMLNIWYKKKVIDLYRARC